MKKLITAILSVGCICLLFACTNPDQARSVLSAQGYKDIEITGYNLMACSEDDFYHTGFSATSPAGVRISGTVCSGVMFKRATIRF